MYHTDELQMVSKEKETQLLQMQSEYASMFVFFQLFALKIENDRAMVVQMSYKCSKRCQEQRILNSINLLVGRYNLSANALGQGNN